MYIPFTVDDFATRIAIRSRNTNRWTTEEIRFSIQQGIEDWSTRVPVPYVYSFTMSDSDQTFQLPVYLTGIVIPQYMDDNDEWNDIRVYSVEPDTAGRRLIRITLRRGGQRAGRLLWWGRNGTPPSTTPTLLANITSSSTELTFTSDEFVSDTGVVKLGDEWMQYAGSSQANGIVTLTNLERGMYGTTAASHDAGVDVKFGFVMHRMDLLQELEDYVFMQLYTLLLRGGNSGERQSFEAMLNYHMSMVNAYWRKYISPKPIPTSLHPDSIGQPLDTRRMWPSSGDRWRYN